MNTLADFKRLDVGTVLELVQADGMPEHKYLNVPRKIEHKQSNAIRFEGGSWLYYPKANEFSFENDLIIISYRMNTHKKDSDIHKLYYKIHSN